MYVFFKGEEKQETSGDEIRTDLNLGYYSHMVTRVSQISSLKTLSVITSLKNKWLDKD